MHNLTYLFKKLISADAKYPDEHEITTSLDRRKKFLRYVNRGWLAFGLVTLLTLPIYPTLQAVFVFLIATTLPSYFVVRFLNLSGKTRLAGIVFTLCVNFSFYGLFLLYVSKLGGEEAFETQATIWMLMGLAVLFAGAFVDKWAAPALAMLNSFLLIGTRLLTAPNSDPRPSALVFWWLLAITIWLYEHTLDQALAKLLNELKERGHTEDELRNHAETITALYETTHDLVIERDLSKLLNTIVERATRLLDAGGGGLYLNEPELNQVRCAVSYNTPRDFTGTTLKYGEGAAGLVAQTMKPVIVDDYSTWEGRAAVYENERPFSAVLSVPMIWQTELIGVIHVLEFKKEHHFTDDDLKLVVSFANQAAIAVHNARMYNQVQAELAERKAAEAALLESEARFESIFRASPIWISVTEFDTGQFILVNDAFSSISGYTREEAIGRTTRELNIWAIPHDRDILVETLRKRERVRDFETLLRMKSGEFRNVIMFAELVNLGNRPYIVSQSYDITERKRTEESLRFTQFAIDHSADSTIWLAKETGRVVYVNDAACQMLNYCRDELLSLTAFDIDPNVPLAGWHKNFEILKAQGSIHFESTHKTKDGQLIPVEVTANYVEFGGQVYNCAFIRDITVRKLAEEKLRVSEKQYRSLFENMLEGYAYCQMLYTDNVATDFIYIDVNPVFQSLTGLQDVIGKKVSDIIPGIQETNPELFEIYGRVSSTGQPEQFETYLAVLKIWFSISVFCPIKGYFVAVFDNITERKNFEESLQRLNIELEARVAQRTAQLETANRELESFSYSVSHDLRTPLRSIDGFSQILIQDFAPELSDEARRHLERIRESSNRMGRLINDLLMLSRMTRQIVRYTTINLSSMAQTIISELKDSAPKRSSEFIIAAGLIDQGDPGLLQIVLQNLLNNAWKFTGKREQTLIEFGCNIQDDNSKIYFVRDNGAGFNPDYAAKLFGAFQRLHSESEFEGNGIGLATVQRIISLHGGKIWAEGEVEKGATFYFTLGQK